MRIWIALLMLAACGPEKEDYRKVKPEDLAPPPSEKKLAPPPKVAMPSDLGKCELELSGAVTGKQTSKGGRDATNVSYWFTEEERRNMMGVDGFVINCHGDTVRFSIIPAGGKIDGMPFKPKKYEFTKGRSDGATAMIALNDKKSVTSVNGAIDITTFDSTHIVGTIDLTGKLSPGTGEVKLTGSFDLACPGFKGCNK
jgi:hypothetical protein